MKLFRTFALAGLTATVLILSGCAPATGETAPPVVEVDPSIIKDFEDGSLTGITVTKPTVDTKVNDLEASLTVSIATDKGSPNHSIREFNGTGGQAGNTDSRGDWDAGGFSNGAKSLKFDYGTGVDSGRVSLNLDPVTFPDLADYDGLEFSLLFPDATGGVGTIVVIHGSDDVDYSSTKIGSTAAPTAGAYDGTWTYSIMDKVWSTYKVPLSQFKADDGTLLTDAVADGTTIDSISFVFRLALGDPWVTIDTTYSAYLDVVKLY